MKSGDAEHFLSQPGTVVARLPGDGLEWGIFEDPLEVLTAFSCDGIKRVLDLTGIRAQEGRALAGFISYEAAPGFDRVHKVKAAPGIMPLIWFGVYERFRKFEFSGECSPEVPEISPEIDSDKYRELLAKVKKYIYEGDIYQANLTYRMRGKMLSDAEALFLSLFSKHPAPYSAFVNTGEFKIVSNSPELFIETGGGVIKSIPMKGTSPRSPFPDEDAELARTLAVDPKNNAENLMITDMVRNDLGRICVPGTVRTGPLFHVDTYATLHQMVSTVRGELRENLSLYEIFKAVFPAASITGAPKIRAMEVIEELEKSPRCIYTGTIGCVMPGGTASCFNVAIRTLAVHGGVCELGVGGGIVADSEPASEWAESLLKSRFLFNAGEPDFKVLETMLLDNGVFAFPEEHIRRAGKSQLYFGRGFDESILREKLHFLANEKGRGLFRVRMLLEPDGGVELQCQELKSASWPSSELQIKISDKRTSSADVFLYHKTTNRFLYDNEFAAALAEGFDEVIFLNEKGEVTEGAISNIFILNDSKWYTPELRCGLLPGIWRKKMIAELSAVETKISLSDLKNAEKIILCNSVRNSSPVSGIRF